MKAMMVRMTLWGISTALVLLSMSRSATAEEATGGKTATAESDEAFLSASGEEERSGDDKAGDDKAGDDASPPTDDTPGAEGEKWGGRKRDHGKQGFVNLLVGTGYFLVAPYSKDDENKRCADDPDNPGRGEPLCSGRSGWHLDMLAGYGLKPGFELFAIFRLGLEQPSGDGLKHQPKVRQVGAGLKIYTPKDGLFKLAFGVAPLFDFSNRGDIGVRPDFVIHVPIAAHFDILPWFAAYAQVSPNLSFIAEFRLEFTGGIGVQGRFP
jgi:hypothetical protein